MRETTGQRLRATIPVWREALAQENSSIRPASSAWSIIEYGCHVRDVCRLFRQRLDLMRAENDPTFANWDQDATAVEDDYSHQDAAAVAEAMAAEVEATAAAFDAVREDQWQRSS